MLKIESTDFCFEQFYSQNKHYSRQQFVNVLYRININGEKLTNIFSQVNMQKRFSNLLARNNTSLTEIKEEFIKSQEKTITHLYLKERVTRKEIARKYSIATSKVTKILDKNDVKVKLIKKVSLEDEQKIKKLYLSNVPAREIEKIFNISRSTVLSYVKDVEKFKNKYVFDIDGADNILRDNIVYMYTNKITNKRYIGITVDEKTRKRRHKIASRKIINKFYNSVNKHGWDAFEYEVLKRNLTRKEALYEEIMFIKKYDSYNNGYNSTIGGDGGIVSILTKEELNEVLNLYLKGVNLNQISKKLNLSRSAITRAIEKKGIDIEKDLDKIKKSKETKEKEIINLYSKGIGVQKILNDNNVSRSTLYRILKKHNIKTRKKTNN